MAFPSEPLVSGIFGYGGPLFLAVAARPSGELLGLRVLQSNETPGYLEEVREWFGQLLGMNIFDASPLVEVDALSGATLTSEAVLRTLREAGPRFAETALGAEKAAPRPGNNSSAGPGAGFFWLTAFLLGAAVQRFYPNRWLRRGFLLAALLVLGFRHNLQFSTQQVFSLLSGHWPPVSASPAFLLLAVLPVSVLLFGNFYCGYVCPFGALQELAGDLRPHRLDLDPSKRAWRYGRALKYVLLFILVLAFSLSREQAVLSADPLITFFSTLREETAFVFGLSMVALAFFFRRFWCRNLCPAGAFLSLLNRVRLLRGLSPEPRPRFCDLGVRNTRELDCIRCDRCRHGKK